MVRGAYSWGILSFSAVPAKHQVINTSIYIFLVYIVMHDINYFLYSYMYDPLSPVLTNQFLFCIKFSHCMFLHLLFNEKCIMQQWTVDHCLSNAFVFTFSSTTSTMTSNHFFIISNNNHAYTSITFFLDVQGRLER